MSEPIKLRAGTTWAWTREESSYPAPTWVLTYQAKNADYNFTITATNLAGIHNISVPMATTAAIRAGRYDWVAFVTDGSSRYEIGNGSWEILPDFTSQGVSDGRSDSRRFYDALKSAYEQYLADGALRQSYQIGDRTMQFKTPEALLKELVFWEQRVQAEDATQDVAAGLGNPRRFYVRF